VREQAHRAGQPREADLERNRHLLLDFFRRASRVQRDHRHLRVGDVGERLDREVVERPQAGDDKQRQAEHDEERLIKRERDDASDQDVCPRATLTARNEWTLAPSLRQIDAPLTAH
jgi:hypothetical protein